MLRQVCPKRTTLFRVRLHELVTEHVTTACGGGGTVTWSRRLGMKCVHCGRALEITTTVSAGATNPATGEEAVG